MRLVDSSADKKRLPRFRPPKGKALHPACLVLIGGVTMARSVDAISLGFLVVIIPIPRSVPSQPLYGGPGSRVYRLGLQLSLQTDIVYGLENSFFGVGLPIGLLLLGRSLSPHQAPQPWYTRRVLPRHHLSKIISITCGETSCIQLC